MRYLLCSEIGGNGRAGESSIPEKSLPARARRARVGGGSKQDSRINVFLRRRRKAGRARTVDINRSWELSFNVIGSRPIAGRLVIDGRKYSRQNCIPVARNQEAARRDYAGDRD